MHKLKLIFIGLILFAAVGYALAQSTMMQMQAPQGIQELRFDNHSEGLLQLRTPDGHRLIATPREAEEPEITNDGRNLLESLKKSCEDCQQTPLVDGVSIRRVTTTPKNAVIEFCKRHPGEFGCSKK